jgi:hypothetical protein
MKSRNLRPNYEIPERVKRVGLARADASEVVSMIFARDARQPDYSVLSGRKLDL